MGLRKGEEGSRVLYLKQEEGERQGKKQSTQSPGLRTFWAGVKVSRINERKREDA